MKKLLLIALVAAGCNNEQNNAFKGASDIYDAKVVTIDGCEYI